MKDTLEFFMSLNIPVTEIYGMSESTGIVLEHNLFHTAFVENLLRLPLFPVIESERRAI